MSPQAVDDVANSWRATMSTLTVVERCWLAQWRNYWPRRPRNAGRPRAYGGPELWH